MEPNRYERKRMELLDDAYHRYAFNDTENAPSWFQEDEQKHNRRPLPITKDMVNAFKEQLRSINARPIKKIAEAKARKN
eukprot:TRINITY_DN2795_c0_g1_i1.p1 TRINITY_DN2795_c0_g1~~TRINITY_DN2795_c0_g1_i1.p1  ORF type:complete len:79 (-),score=10.03 TRINITY_DN2795_c0_g1_i1:224-460(-)